MKARRLILPLLGQQRLFWRSPVNWYTLLLIAAFISSRSAPLRVLAKATRLPANAAGLFAACFSDSWLLLGFSAGAVALFSSAPFIHPCHTQELLRSGQRRHVCLRLCHIALTGLIYTLFLFVCVWLSSGSSLYPLHRWGKVLSAIAAGNLPAELGIRITVPMALTQSYSPPGAAAQAAAMCFATVTALGFAMYGLSLLISRQAALLLGASVSIFDISIEQIGLGYRMYRFSPWSWLRPDLLLDDSNPYLAGHDLTLILIAAALSLTLLLALWAGCRPGALEAMQKTQNQQE